jgi:hypothetical protein
MSWRGTAVTDDDVYEGAATLDADVGAGAGLGSGFAAGAFFPLERRM